MRVDAAGDGEHGVLCALPDSAQPVEENLVRLAGAVPADAEHLREPGGQHSSAVHKRRKVHIRVGAGVAAVHKTRLGRRGDLVQHGPRDARRETAGKRAAHIVAEQAADLKAQQLRCVRSAAAAHLGISAAEQTTPGRLSDHRAADRDAGAVKHVHVKQPPERVRFFDLNGSLLGFQRRNGQRKQSFAARDRIRQLFLPDRRKDAAKLRKAGKKALTGKGKLLDRAGNIHGKADEAGIPGGEQRALARYACLAVFEDLAGAGRRGVIDAGNVHAQPSFSGKRQRRVVGGSRASASSRPSRVESSVRTREALMI